MHSDAKDTEVINCWIPLVDVSMRMGCLRIAKGRFSYLPHITDKYVGRTIIPELVNNFDPIMAECVVGDVVLMGPLTPHKSFPNETSKCRWSLDLRYHPTGQHSGRLSFPEFVVESAKTNHSVPIDYDKWCNLWINALSKKIKNKYRND